jgi:hypothetical protein
MLLASNRPTSAIITVVTRNHLKKGLSQPMYHIVAGIYTRQDGHKIFAVFIS